MDTQRLHIVQVNMEGNERAFPFPSNLEFSRQMVRHVLCHEERRQQDAGYDNHLWASLRQALHESIF